MWIRRVRLVNFGPFIDFTANLTRGSIGLVGRNGAGKSTFLNAIYGCISNDFGRFPGVKTDCVRLTAEKGAQSFIEVEIEHDAHVLLIRRNLSGKGKTELVVDQGVPITDSARAQIEIDKLLGVDRRMLDLYVFKTQDRIYDFLATTTAERAKAYATLCGTAHCEDLWDMVGKQADKDRNAIDQTVDNSDELNRNLEDLQYQVTELDQAAGEARAKCLNAKSEASAREIIRKAHLAASLGPQVTEAEEHFEECSRVAANRKRQRDQLEVVVTDLEAVAAEAKPAAEEARAAHKNLAEHTRRVVARAKLVSESKVLATEGKNKAEPVRKYPASITIAKSQQRLYDQQATLRAARKLIATFAENGVVACPTCGTPVESFETELLAAQDTVKGPLSADIAETIQIIAELEAYELSLQAYERWKSGYDARVAANKKALEANPASTAPPGDPDALTKIIATSTAADSALAAARTQLRDAETALARADANEEAADKARQDLTTWLLEAQQDESLIAKAETRLAEHTVVANEASRLEGEAKGLRTLLDRVRQDIAALKARLKRGRKLKKVVATMDVAHDVLHRNRLPRRVAASNLVRMEADINAGLAEFGDPYWVETDETLSFVAHKPGEPAQPAERLSTGQKVVLALAFWPAVASLWSADLGTLVLDEPTANLDAANRACLAQALGRLSGQVRGRRQLIIVTHDPDLKSAFDQVVDLG